MVAPSFAHPQVALSLGGGRWAPSLGSPWVASSRWVALPGLRVPVADVPAGGGPCTGAPASLGTGVRPRLSSWLLHFRHFQLRGIGEWGEGTVLGIWGLHPPRGLVPSACSTGQGWGHRCCFSPPPWERGPTDGRHWNPPPMGAQGKGIWVPPAGSAPGGPRQPVAVPGLVLASVTRRDAVSQRSPRPAPSSRSPRPRWAGWGPSLPGCHRCRPGD